MAALLLTTASLAQTSSPQNPPPAPCPASNQGSSPSQSTAQPSSDQSGKPCAPAAPKKSTAEQFPFPGASAKPATPPPDAPGQKTSPSDAATQHPFPTQLPPKLPGDESSSSSSSSTPDDVDPAHPDDPTGTGNPPEGTSVHRKLPKPPRVQSDDERVDEDLSVAKFYLRDENYQGAYLRAKMPSKSSPTTQPLISLWRRSRRS